MLMVTRLVVVGVGVDEVPVEGGVVSGVAVERVARIAMETEPDRVAKLQLQHDALALHLRVGAEFIMPTISHPVLHQDADNKHIIQSSTSHSLSFREIIPSVLLSVPTLTQISAV